jgi:peroxiredoxin
MSLARLFVLCLVLGLIAQPDSGLAATATVGQPAPPWQLTNIQGQPVRLNDFVGQVVLLNFFRTTCVPCLWEIPDFSELKNQYGSEGLVVIGIAAEEDAATLEPFAAAQHVDYTLCPSNDGVLWDYNVFPLGGIPLTVVIDRAGIVADWYRYYQTKAYHESKIVPLLAARPGPALAISTLNGALEISWPTNAEGFLLETRSSFATNKQWQLASEQVMVEADRRIVHWPISRGAAFFRLRKP